MFPVSRPRLCNYQHWINLFRWITASHVWLWQFPSVSGDTSRNELDFSQLSKHTWTKNHHSFFEFHHSFFEFIYVDAFCLFNKSIKYWLNSHLDWLIYSISLLITGSLAVSFGACPPNLPRPSDPTACLPTDRQRRSHENRDKRKRWWFWVQIVWFQDVHGLLVGWLVGWERLTFLKHEIFH